MRERERQKKKIYNRGEREEEEEEEEGEGEERRERKGLWRPGSRLPGVRTQDRQPQQVARGGQGGWGPLQTLQPSWPHRDFNSSWGADGI
jgi:hypothetical protein